MKETPRMKPPIHITADERVLQSERPSIFQIIEQAG